MQNAAQLKLFNEIMNLFKKSSKEFFLPLINKALFMMFFFCFFTCNIRNNEKSMMSVKDRIATLNKAESKQKKPKIKKDLVFEGLREKNPQVVLSMPHNTNEEKESNLQDNKNKRELDIIANPINEKLKYQDKMTVYRDVNTNRILQTFSKTNDEIAELKDKNNAVSQEVAKRYKHRITQSMDYYNSIDQNFKKAGDIYSNAIFQQFSNNEVSAEDFFNKSINLSKTAQILHLEQVKNMSNTQLEILQSELTQFNHMIDSNNKQLTKRKDLVRSEMQKDMQVSNDLIAKSSDFEREQSQKDFMLTKKQYIDKNATQRDEISKNEKLKLETRKNSLAITKQKQQNKLENVKNTFELKRNMFVQMNKSKREEHEKNEKLKFETRRKSLTITKEEQQNELKNKNLELETRKKSLAITKQKQQNELESAKNTFELKRNMFIQINKSKREEHEKNENSRLQIKRNEQKNKLKHFVESFEMKKDIVIQVNKIKKEEDETALASKKKWHQQQIETKKAQNHLEYEKEKAKNLVIKRQNKEKERHKRDKNETKRMHQENQIRLKSLRKLEEEKEQERRNLKAIKVFETKQVRGYRTDAKCYITVFGTGKFDANFELIYYDSSTKRFRIELIFKNSLGKNLHSWTTPDIELRNLEDTSKIYQGKNVPKYLINNIKKVDLIFRWAVIR